MTVSGEGTKGGPWPPSMTEADAYRIWTEAGRDGVACGLSGEALRKHVVAALTPLFSCEIGHEDDEWPASALNGWRVVVEVDAADNVTVSVAGLDRDVAVGLLREAADALAAAPDESTASYEPLRAEDPDEAADPAAPASWVGLYCCKPISGGWCYREPGHEGGHLSAIPVNQVDLATGRVVPRAASDEFVSACPACSQPFVSYEYEGAPESFIGDGQFTVPLSPTTRTVCCANGHDHRVVEAVRDERGIRVRLARP